MKLRLLVLALLIANLLALAWHLGWLDWMVGTELRTDREPQRVLQQVQPQAIVIVPPSATPNSATRVPARTPTSTPTPAPAPAPALESASAPAGRSTALASSSAVGNVPSCLEAGPFSNIDIETAEKSMAGLSPDVWKRVTIERPPGYGIVMGPFPTAEAQRVKAAELERLKQRFERIPQPNADGTTSTRAAATVFLLQRVASREAGASVLASLAQRGVRTARIVLVSPASVVFNLRVENAPVGEMSLLMNTGSGVEARPFGACPP